MVEFSLWDIFRNLLLAISVRRMLTWVGPRFLFSASAKAGAR